MILSYFAGGGAQEDGVVHGQVLQDQLVEGGAPEGEADHEREEARLEQADVGQDDGGGAQEDGEAHGQVLEDQLVHGVSSEGGADRERDEARLEQADGDGRADPEHRGQAPHVDGHCEHGGGQEEQSTRVFVRRKVRLSDGVVRDRRLQLSMVNFFAKSGGPRGG